MSLVQRIVELTVRLVGARLEQTGAELKTGAARVGRAAAWAFAGGLLIALGVGAVAAAAVEALAPLVAARSLRLLIVAAPLFALGAVAIRAARARARSAGPAPAEGEARRDRAAARQPEQPEHEATS